MWLEKASLKIVIEPSRIVDGGQFKAIFDPWQRSLFSRERTPGKEPLLAGKFIASVYSQELAQLFVGLQLKIFKPHELYSIEIFAVQSMNRQLCYVTCKVVFWPTLSLPVYQNAHVLYNSVCEIYAIKCLFYFQCSTVNIYKYKGEYVLRRIPHASDGWKL